MTAPLGRRLKAVKWGEFRIIDIFDIRNTHCILSNEVVPDSGTDPYLCASGDNNAVSSYISFNPALREKGNCIFIGGKTFVVTYQANDFYSNDSHNLVLYLKTASEATKPHLLFVAACITRSLGGKYTWGSSISHSKIKGDSISLPVNTSGSIDFAFMDEFMRELEEERMRELAAYLTISGLDNCELSNSERKALESFSCLWQWENKPVTNVFEIKNTHNILASDVISDSGETPYLCASAEHNSVSSYISYNVDFLERGKCVFIGGKTFVVSCQEKDFFSNDSHNLALYPKKQVPSRENLLFWATCIGKSLGHKYTWGNSISKAKILGDSVTLPIFCDAVELKHFMRAVQKLVIRDVVAWRDREIEATRQVVDGRTASPASSIVLPDVASELRFREYLPLYSLKAACGKFGEGEAVEPLGWVKADIGRNLDDKMFVVQASGRSMEPKIRDGSFCVMRTLGAETGGSREGKIVLAQHRDFSDPETGGSYSIKRYSSEKAVLEDNSWSHERITLSPLNPEFNPLVFTSDSPEDDLKMIAEFLAVLPNREKTPGHRLANGCAAWQVPLENNAKTGGSTEKNLD